MAHHCQTPTVIGGLENLVLVMNQMETVLVYAWLAMTQMADVGVILSAKED